MDSIHRRMLDLTAEMRETLLAPITEETPAKMKEQQERLKALRDELAGKLQ